MVCIFYAATAISGFFPKVDTFLVSSENSSTFQHDGHRLQWLSTHAHSGLMSIGSPETAW